MNNLWIDKIRLWLWTHKLKKLNDSITQETEFDCRSLKLMVVRFTAKGTQTVNANYETILNVGSEDFPDIIEIKLVLSQIMNSKIFGKNGVSKGVVEFCDYDRNKKKLKYW